ncbi:MAG: uroporphyrinogen decarboxylase family protein [bacterium]
MKARKQEQSPEELYQERERRVRDAIELRVPDRVPLTPFYMFYPAFQAGMNAKQAMYDYSGLEDVARNMVQDFGFDMFNNLHPIVSLGPLLDILQWKQFKWPGQQIAEDYTYQFVEDEYMPPEDYDAFLNDPTGYILRTYLPRTFDSLAGLKRFPSLPSLYYTRFLTGTRAFGLPELGGALEVLAEAGREAKKLLDRGAAYQQEMRALGVPMQFGATAYAPFDYIGDLYRGTVGVMTDLYRRPDKLLAMMEKLVPYIIQGAVGATRATGVPVAFMPLHKGLDGFMSPKHFEEFYWPSLKAVILGLIDLDIVPLVLWEGNCDSRLEQIRIPKGKAIYWFEKTDLFRAKEILGDVVCLRGNVPASLLNTGTPDEVTAYCRQLIEVVGKDGGFIMDGAIGIPDEAKPENVKAMCDAVFEYGRYA